MLSNYGYKHRLRMCNIYYFSTALMDTRTHPSVNVIRTLRVLLVPPGNYWIGTLKYITIASF
jgi:hypothetical protein